MNKVVVISGGSDGLGKAIAGKLSANNTVVIIARDENKLSAVTEKLGVDSFICDVSDYVAVEKVIAKILEKYKRIDTLVNNAAVWIEGELESNSAEDIKRTVEINCVGYVNCAKAVIPAMKKQKDGLIININSQGGFYAKKERSVYSLTKWGITGFTKSLQEELSPYGISVTGIYPAKMNTKMFEKVGINKNMSDAIDPIEVARIVEFLLQTTKGVYFPEIGIKSLQY